MVPSLSSTSPTRRRRRVSYGKSHESYIQEPGVGLSRTRLLVISALIAVGSLARGIDVLAMKIAYKLGGYGGRK